MAGIIRDRRRQYQQRLASYAPPENREYSWEEVENTLNWHYNQVKWQGPEWATTHQQTGEAWKSLAAKMRARNDPVQNARRAFLQAKGADKRRWRQEYSRLKRTCDGEQRSGLASVLQCSPSKSS